jgi:Flp pilus assembly protein TadG
MMARKIRPRRHGTAAVECAVVLTLLVPMLLAVWEVGRLVQVQELLVNAAREGGRQAATGYMTTAQVQQVVVNYLTQNKITCATSNVTVTNLTSSARNDPTTANQLDQYQITVSIPFNTVQWVLINQITPPTNITASAIWYSTADLPISVNSNIPLN